MEPSTTQILIEQFSTVPESNISRRLCNQMTCAADNVHTGFTLYTWPITYVISSDFQANVCEAGLSHKAECPWYKYCTPRVRNSRLWWGEHLNAVARSAILWSKRRPAANQDVACWSNILEVTGERSGGCSSRLVCRGKTTESRVQSVRTVWQKRAW